MNIDRSSLRKLLLTPERDSYVYDIANDGIHTDLKNSFMQSRYNVESNASVVRLSWILTPFEYEYFVAFFCGITMGGAIPFLLDMIADKSEIEEFIVKFVPNSLTMSEPSKFSFFQDADVEVLPNQ